MNARKVFAETYGDSPNFMTPMVMEYGATTEHVYELSRGEGILGGSLFGVTILTHDGERTELSKSFDTLEEATEYIAKIG